MFPFGHIMLCERQKKCASISILQKIAWSKCLKNHLMWVYTVFCDLRVFFLQNSQFHHSYTCTLSKLMEIHFMFMQRVFALYFLCQWFDLLGHFKSESFAVSQVTFCYFDNPLAAFISHQLILIKFDMLFYTIFLNNSIFALHYYCINTFF